MQITAYTDLYPHIMPQVSGCDADLVLPAIQRTARDFCRDTEAWRETLWPLALRDTKDQYTLVWDYEAEILRIIEVRWNTEDGVDADLKGNPVPASEYTLEVNADGECRDVLTFNTAPTATVSRGLEVDVCYLPHMDAEGISAEMIDRWSEAIIAGALVRLMIMPEKPWANPSLAAFNKGEYDRYWQLAKGEVRREHKSGPEGFGA